MKADSLIFDLDGTMWDSCEAVALSWEEVMEGSYGGRCHYTEQDVRSIMGMTEDEIVKALFAPFGEDGAKVCRECMDAENAYIAKHGAKLYPQLEETLKALSERLPLFIVSNCQRGYVEAYLESSGFAGYFRDYECSGRTGIKKDKNIALVMERNGLKAPVYIGDTQMDEAAAKGAGIPFIHAAYGFGKAEAPAGVINALPELLDIIEV